jgi:hypothetical protein
MGLWDTSKPSCNFTGVKKVSDFTDATRPDWMDVAKPAPSAPVYVESAGAAVFTTICYNCHGVLADSRGLLADAIVNLTGGDARVADFRDGLFGPLSNPGANRAAVFGPDATKLMVTPDDLGSRYMAYMALGGTQKHLPGAVLRQVAQAPVFGKLRANLAILGSPDMLQLGLVLCTQIATASPDAVIPISDLQGGRIKWGDRTGLIDTSGDAEMWLKLCSLDNRPLVRVVSPGPAWTAAQVKDLTLSGHQEYWGDGTGPDGQPLYPATAPVMDHHLQVRQGITTDNYLPICAAKPDDPVQLQAANALLASVAVGGPGGAVIPYCPPGFVVPSNLVIDGGTTFPDAQKWAARGAINAARAVFLYLNQIESEPTKRQPLYNQCDQLPGATTN